MKKLCIATVIAVCLALCAAAWPQTVPTEEVSATQPLPAVTATQPEVPQTPAIEDPIMPEEEKAEIARPESLPEIIPEPEPTPEEVPAALEVELTPEPVPVPAPPQAVTEPQPGGTVYVPGFGWLESQGAGEVVYAEDIYENGNKIGSIG